MFQFLQSHGKLFSAKGYHACQALVAELVDAQHSGCCAHTGVEVRVLSRAPIKRAGYACLGRIIA